MESEPFLTSDEWERRFGEGVRKVRQRMGLTQAELAERANVSLSAVKYLEKGSGSSLGTIVRLARVLDRTSWLDAWVPPEPTISPIALLRERQHASTSSRKRVRRKKSPGSA
jgi:transcriptional regulator with XRE-family HTH domain